MPEGTRTISLHALELRGPGTPEADDAVLTPSERQQVGRMPRADLRLRRSRILSWLRRTLGERLGIAPAEVPLGTGSHGKPFLVDPDGGPPWGLHFNLTHTDDHAWLALGGMPLGLDLESRARAGSMDLEPVSGRFYAPSEQSAFARAGDRDARGLEFLRIWTRKEALIKAVGRGLHCPLESFAVPTGPLPPQGVVVACPEGTRRRWHLVEPPLPEPWRTSDVAALAMDLGEDFTGPPPTVEFVS